MAKPPEITTVLELIAWSYANLARADAALSADCTRYKVVHHMIRAKLYKGLTTGKMKMRSLFDDERIKMTMPRACSYCGSREKLSMDHLIPRVKGGPDEADNLVLSCRSCNSSKGGLDMLAWMARQQNFPAIYLLRRYLKIVARYCENNGLMDDPLDGLHDDEIPFELRRIPRSFPPLEQLRLWVEPSSPLINSDDCR